MALLLTPVFGTPDEWRRLIAAEMPDLDVRIWPDDVGDPTDIEIAAVAGFPRGKLKTFPNLRLIVSLTAGIDMLIGDPDLPAVPIVRAADPAGDAMIDEFALLHVLRHHRELPELALAQQSGKWIRLKPKHAHERPVGVMGLGTIGLSVARTLARHGFAVAGWVRSPRQVDGVTIFHGSGQLPAFLARSEIVINLLPLTAETEEILNASTFAQMPKGAAVINLGRGPHIAEADLMAALDSGHLAAATLDVFPVEPLPKESPLWRHPRITVTPHVSRRIYPSNLAPRVCDAVRRFGAGEPLPYLVDRRRGY